MGIKIEAAARLRASVHKLMARSTPVSKIAESGMKEITRQMAMRGFHVNTTQSKALYTTKFVKEEKTGEQSVCEMVGWHGAGRYGSEKTILEFYDESRGHKPIISIGVLNEENLNPIKQQDIVNEITNYIKKYF